MQQSIWEKNKDSILRNIGIVAVLFLIVANVWLVGQAATRQTSGVNLSPADIGSFFTGAGARTTWKEPRNILILGRAGENNNAPYLTDTILIAHFDVVDNSIKLVSLPRDLLVKTPEEDRFIKLNALWSYTATANRTHFDPTVEAVEKITGLTIDNVVVFDLATLEKIIAAVDGVVVHVPRDIYDPRFPTASGGYETFSLQSGWRHLDAEMAERFVRTRHSASGDFDRIQHQQELVKSVKGKISTLNPVWDFGTLWSVYEAVQDNVITDISVVDARALWNFANNLSLEEMESFVLNTDTGLVTPRTVQFGSAPAYTLVATGEDPFDYSTIRQEIQAFLGE